MLTLYVAPGSNQCRVYAIPYAMRPGQSPSDILPSFQRDWREVALLRPDYCAKRLDLVYLDPAYAAHREDIANASAGEFWEVAS